MALFGGKRKGKEYGGVTLPHFRTTFDTLLTIDFSLSFVCQLQTKEVPDKRYGLLQSSKASEKLGGPLLGCFVNIFLRCFNIICVLQMQSEKTFQTMCTERVHCWCFSDFCKGQAFVIQHQNSSSYLLCVILLHIQSPFRLPAPLIVCVHDCCSYVPQWPFFISFALQRAYSSSSKSINIYCVKEWDFTGQPKERTAYFCNFEDLHANSQIFLLIFNTADSIRPRCVCLQTIYLAFFISFALQQAYSSSSKTINIYCGKE